MSCVKSETEMWRRLAHRARPKHCPTSKRLDASLRDQDRWRHAVPRWPFNANLIWRAGARIPLANSTLGRVLPKTGLAGLATSTSSRKDFAVGLLSGTVRPWTSSTEMPRFRAKACALCRFRSRSHRSCWGLSTSLAGQGWRPTSAMSLQGIEKPGRSPHWAPAHHHTINVSSSSVDRFPNSPQCCLRKASAARAPRPCKRIRNSHSGSSLLRGPRR